MHVTRFIPRFATHSEMLMLFIAQMP